MAASGHSGTPLAKKISIKPRHTSDISENDLRDMFLPLGVVDVKVASLGEDWSGLKFVRRRENRRS
ncbi:hypothetical protein [Phytoactinopolyspora halotolerans]|uniref:Uncharacterized protein n=1 Tax=Phytoactinopolyspora halotolerans TaxID=1981512 RepID=A0A6L9S5U4_9ACTN|nr:hypothetical protein [Phytoactinopolyspora halotolerans]NED99439.1 hypothetical protein [Phytoactinopolyspora halotolerans]